MVNNQDRLTEVFAALADPTRRQILMRLARRGESPVTTLAKPFRISAPAISRHLRVLENARLITRRRTGRVHVISIEPSSLASAHDWMTACAAGWDFSFDALDRLLKQQQAPHPGK